ncbi:hypothetical protein SpCBS45565_g01393 [Spizellomyces sp. 'palustris']|nr:hypothetical protein SpCBS45565_g01393 [Spizellomyces sp. 'palustris']
MTRLDAKRLVQNAHEADNWLLGCSTPLHYQTDGQTITITLYSLRNLPSDLHQWAFNLVKHNLYDQYITAKDTGWSDQDKLAEMSEEHAMYLIAQASDGQLVGFLYFQFVMEDYCADDNESGEDSSDDKEEEQIPVIYCYELQLESSFQRNGLGAHFMRILEEVGRKYRMEKSMLTVFKSNEAAINFYRQLGYDVDGISPSKHLPPRRAARISYEIFSKCLRQDS